MFREAMKTVIYECPFVPAEWIAAHGLRPSRIVPRLTIGARFAGTSTGVCPYARAFVNHVCVQAAADAIVVTTVCDQMRRAFELIERNCDIPLFLMNVPKTWQTVASQKLYMFELERLSKFLVRIGGKLPSHDEQAAVMLQYDTARRDVRAAHGYLSPREYSEAIARFHERGEADYASSKHAIAPRGVPLALVGGPLLRHHFAIFDMIDRAGGYVALDATSTGERTMAAAFDRRSLRDDPLSELARAYFGTIPDAFRRPNSELYRWLRQNMAERGVRGIIFRHYVWCDTWHAEVQRMKEWTDLPVLVIEASDDESVDGQIASRVQSFIEVLR